MAMSHQSSSQPETIRVHVFVSGKVQGVGYRATTWDTATLLKLKGWVRNLRDGRVEAVFEGPADTVDEMIRWCHQGPPAAKVQDVTIEHEPVEGLQSFQVTR
jgi:acylphosphatase